MATDELADLIVLKEKRVEELLALPNVIGVDVGLKEVGGELTDRLAIRCFVSSKGDVPAARAVPLHLDKTPTDVIEFENASFLQLPALAGGVSVGLCKPGAITGTLGLNVEYDGRIVSLSCFHVLCDGDSIKTNIKVSSPGVRDGEKCDRNEIGDPIKGYMADFAPPPGSLGSITVDAALTGCYARTPLGMIERIGPVEGSATATLGEPVRKMGRTTALTFGFVSGLAGTYVIDYGQPFGKLTFENQICVKADANKNSVFQGQGDSGSVVVNGSNQVLGLLFYGTLNSAIVNPIDDVNAVLQVSPYSYCRPVQFQCLPTDSTADPAHSFYVFALDRADNRIYPFAGGGGGAGDILTYPASQKSYSTFVTVQSPEGKRTEVIGLEMETGKPVLASYEGASPWQEAPLSVYDGPRLTYLAAGYGNHFFPQVIGLDEQGRPHLIWQDADDRWHYSPDALKYNGPELQSLVMGKLPAEDALVVVGLGVDCLLYEMVQSPGGSWSYGGQVKDAQGNVLEVVYSVAAGLGNNGTSLELLGFSLLNAAPQNIYRTLENGSPVWKIRAIPAMNTSHRALGLGRGNKGYLQAVCNNFEDQLDLLWQGSNGDWNWKSNADWLSTLPASAAPMVPLQYDGQLYFFGFDDEGVPFWINQNAAGDWKNRGVFPVPENTGRP